MHKSIHKLRWLMILTAGFTALAALQLPSVLGASGVLSYPVWQTRLLILQIGMGLVAALLSGLAFSPMANQLTELLERWGSRLVKCRGWLIPIAILILVSLLYASLGPFFQYQAGRWVQVWLIWLVGLSVGLLMKAGWPKRGLLFWLAAGWLGTGFALQAGDLFSQVTNYPFAQAWSEGMLLVNAAQIAGEKIWGQAVPWPVINRTHALLQSLSFWLPGIQPLWLHRLWNSILWLSWPLGLMASLCKRLKVGSLAIGVVFCLFGYMFLAQGPIYFNLVVIPLVVMLGFRANRFGRSLAVILLASIWGGLSRLNWFPMAGVVGALLFILETPYGGKFWGYFWKPLTWVASGTALAFGVNQAYLYFIGSTVNHISRVFDSKLLWYRLWPSTTFSLGIVPATIFVSSGLVALVLWRIMMKGGLQIWRRTALLTILLVFLLGGLVASVKIGGGNNLHNLDAFLVLLLVVASYAYFERVTRDIAESPARSTPVWLMAVVLSIPLIYQVPFIPFRPPVGQAIISRVEVQLEEYVSKTQAENKPILFISNQQMIAIQRFPGILPNPNYESVYMMEMAITNNGEYFKDFRDRISKLEWGLIVIDSLSMKTAGRERAFGEEQTAWVNWVVKSIREYYIPVGGSLEAQVIIAEPR